MKCPICKGKTELIYGLADGTRFYRCVKGHRKTVRNWRGRHVVTEHPVFMVKEKTGLNKKVKAENV